MTKDVYVGRSFTLMDYLCYVLFSVYSLIFGFILNSNRSHLYFSFPYNFVCVRNINNCCVRGDM